VSSSFHTIFVYLQKMLSYRFCHRLATKTGMQAQFESFGRDVEIWRGRTEGILQGLGPVLDLLQGFEEGAPAPGSEVGASVDTSTTSIRNIVHRSDRARGNLGRLMRETARDATRRALAVLRSHHPGIESERLLEGFAQGTSEEAGQELLDSSDAVASQFAASYDLEEIDEEDQDGGGGAQ
jgi:hypothetical protein